MAKAAKEKISRGSGGRKSAASSRAKANFPQENESDKLQGRAGGTLPSREKTVVGHAREWERENETPALKVQKNQTSENRAIPRSRRRAKEIEIEYEYGPGSRFQREGRGKSGTRKKERGNPEQRRGR
ncbi:MAG TPA: hypothetical protein VFM25_12330 [Verrucomicrobiae bacterium]|nr:hypothetical protein [Verrucomicrobiae bacterium]